MSVEPVQRQRLQEICLLEGQQTQVVVSGLVRNGGTEECPQSYRTLRLQRKGVQVERPLLRDGELDGG